MNINMYMRKENSGLARTTLELAKYIERAGHGVCLKQPHDDMPIYGKDNGADVHSVHSQLPMKEYYQNVPRFLWTHGEPLSSVSNGISMKAIIDLAPLCDAFISMRKEEWSAWNSIKRTYVVPKGVDLEMYAPQEGIVEKLSGEPSVLYMENWRGVRNPLYIVIGMAQVWQKYPKARLHLYNCTDKKLYETFKALIDHAKFSTFVRSLTGPAQNATEIINKADIVVSGLYPLYARTPVEALACGKAAICMGYREPDYPWTVDDYSPEGFADAIVRCWEDYGKINYREFAEKRHDVQETVRQTLDIYSRYL
jgi:glycosyltransferase involved in cell wall biosynthesis